MRILIATGIYPPDIGGPAKYAKNLKDQFESFGHTVSVLCYGVEKKLPIILRQLYYITRLLKVVRKVDCILALDIVSAGFPAVLVGKIFGKKVVTRVGGDYLWESYINSGGSVVSLKQFNNKKPRLTNKLRIIEHMQSYVLQSSALLVFNTAWLRDIFSSRYNVDSQGTAIVENFWPKKELVNKKDFGNKKTFLFVGRESGVKNVDVLENIFVDIQKTRNDIYFERVQCASPKVVKEKIAKSYAVVLPSISDVAPNVVAEAMALNTPCIITEETGFHKQLEGVVLFVDPFNKEDITQKILLLADKKNYDHYLDKTKNYSHTHSWERIAEEFLVIFETICN